MKERLILASNSERRRELLENCKIPFIKVKPDFNEEIRNVKIKNPVKLAKFLAENKAFSIAKKDEYFNDHVLGVDTLVYCKGKILEKPMDITEAKNMVLLLSGSKHFVITAIALINRSKSLKIVEYTKSTVYFNKIDEEFIDFYLKNDKWYDYAGGYAIQGFFSLVVKKIVGSYTNIVGLPMELLYTILKKINFIMWK